MGQRLVIVNYYEDYPRNSIYFHWSGYTDRAIFELKEFTNYIQENLDKLKTSSHSKIIVKDTIQSKIVWFIQLKSG